jgi:hypothetical protein
MIAKARFALLCNSNIQDLVLMAHGGVDKVSYSLQLLRRDASGKQWTIPIGTIFSEGELEE